MTPTDAAAAVRSLYTAEALVLGDGRNGHGRTSDGSLEVELATPPELGGSGDGINPEQLFAIGYGACYHSALRRVARAAGADVTDSSVGARIQLVRSPGAPGLDLRAELEISLPHVDHAQAVALAEAAHQVCPYSRATRGNIDVSIVVTDD